MLKCSLCYINIFVKLRTRCFSIQAIQYHKTASSHHTSNEGALHRCPPIRPGLQVDGAGGGKTQDGLQEEKGGGVWAMNPVSLIASKTHRPRGAETKSVILNIKGRRPRWIPPDSAFR